jgi:prepilin-type N-terminal cleavage/methylation domain-containing protein
MSRVRGMTLVELLVVFAIVGLLVSLVAPAGGDMLRRAKSQEEWLILDRTVEVLAFRAFSEGREVTLDAKGTRLTWLIDGVPSGYLSLEHCFFDPQQTIVINSNGIADKPTLTIRQNGRARTLTLNRGFEPS